MAAAAACSSGAAGARGRRPRLAGAPGVESAALRRPALVRAGGSADRPGRSAAAPGRHWSTAEPPPSRRQIRPSVCCPPPATRATMACGQNFCQFRHEIALKMSSVAHAFKCEVVSWTISGVNSSVLWFWHTLCTKFLFQWLFSHHVVEANEMFKMLIEGRHEKKFRIVTFAIFPHTYTGFSSYLGSCAFLMYLQVDNGLSLCLFAPSRCECMAAKWYRYRS